MYCTHIDINYWGLSFLSKGWLQLNEWAETFYTLSALSIIQFTTKSSFNSRACPISVLWHQLSKQLFDALHHLQIAIVQSCLVLQIAIVHACLDAIVHCLLSPYV